MYFPTFPLLSIKQSGKKIFCGGGGGNEEYGKENGMLVYDLDLKPILFFKTNSIVKQIVVSESDDIFGCTEILLICLNCIYLVKFDDIKIDLLFKFDREVEMGIFNDIFWILSDGKIFCIGVRNENVEKLNKKLGDGNKDANIHKKKNKKHIKKQITSKIKDDNNDIKFKYEFEEEIKIDENFILKKLKSEKLQSFLFVENELIKVKEKDKKSHFKVKKEVFKFLDLKKVVYSNGKLFSWCGKNDSSIFINKKEYKCKRITCMSVDNGNLVWGTGDGSIYTLYSCYKTIGLPITDVLFHGKEIFYVDLCGNVKKFVPKKRKNIYMVVLCLFLILAFAIMFRTKYKVE